MVNPSPRDKSKFLHVVGLLAASVIEPFPGTIKVYVVTRVDGDFTHIGNPRSLCRLLASLLVVLPGIVHPVTVQTILQYIRTVVLISLIYLTFCLTKAPLPHRCCA